MTAATTPVWTPPPIEITNENRGACENARATIKLNYQELIAMTKRYPVVCEFADYRRIFMSQQDVDALIAHLDEKLGP